MGISQASIWGVIVTYNPPSGLLDNIAMIRPQLARLVIVDNGSAREGLALLQQTTLRYGCDVILNGANFGIAKALNIGISHAESRGCEAVALFDQDSTANDCYIAAMLNGYKEASAFCRVGVVVARHIDPVSGDQIPPVKRRDGQLLAAMTSGSFIPLHVLKALGPHDESLYMDYVDTDLSLRCRLAGYSIVEAREALLKHSLGRLATHTVCGWTFSATHHSPGRRYYITRNRLLVLRRYWRDWSWCVRDIRAFVAETIKIGLVEDGKLSKFKSIARGTVDAVANRTGQRCEL